MSYGSRVISFNKLRINAMGLVDYSDSEGSADEAPPQQPAPTVKPGKRSTSDRPAFEKVVDEPGSKKIKVSLPSVGQNDGKQDQTDDGDSTAGNKAKKASAFSGFGSLLPAPKNAAGAKSATGGGSFLAQNKGARPAGRINLKTSATPAFSRAPVPGAEEYDEYDEQPVTQNSQNQQPPGPPHIESSTGEETRTQDEEKPVAKPVMFKPLSVTRKPAKKKPPAGASGHSTSDGSAPLNPKATSPSATTAQAVPAPKPKVSLFSSGGDDVAMDVQQKEEREYEPMMLDDDPVEATETNSVQQENVITSASQATQATDLGTLANNLGLSASERRQLFGRGGQLTNAQVAQFNLAEEYKRNQEMRENEETAPSHNPIKSIAPGKHSLQQLVNAAQSNKEALDESFARGKSNKKAAGSKYGW